jgi:hypothetical protein
VMPLKFCGTEKVLVVEVETPPPPDEHPPTIFAHGTCKVLGLGVIVLDAELGTQRPGVRGPVLPGVSAPADAEEATV